MDKNDHLWYETGEEFPKNNLTAFEPFSSVAHEAINTIENETVAFLRKRIPSNIKFLRPIAYEYMARIYDKVIFEYAADELGIKLSQKSLQC